MLFYGKKSIKRSSKRRRPSKGVLWKEGFKGSSEKEKHQKVFYEKKIIERSSMERRPSKGFLWKEDLQIIFNGKKTLKRYSVESRPFEELL